MDKMPAARLGQAKRPADRREGGRQCESRSEIER